MAKSIYVSRGNLTGIGKTKTEAKANLKKQIDQLCEGSFSPVFITCDGTTVVIYRDRDTWNYTLLTPERLNEQGEHHLGYTMCGTKEDAIRSAKHHLMQLSPNLFNFRKAEDLPDWFDGDREDILDYARWQRAAKYAKEVLGLDSNGVHAWACQHERDEQFQ